MTILRLVSHFALQIFHFLIKQYSTRSGRPVFVTASVGVSFEGQTFDHIHRAISCTPLVREGSGVAWIKFKL